MKLNLRHRQQLGKLGEDLAVSYLLRHGYRIIERNFQKRYGELDIICVEGETLVFVEVKTRIGQAFGSPEEAVTPRKLREVVVTAQYYAQLHSELPQALRIDVVAIELDKNRQIASLKHIQNVTS